MKSSAAEKGTHESGDKTENNSTKMTHETEQSRANINKSYTFLLSSFPCYRRYTSTYLSISVVHVSALSHENGERVQVINNGALCKYATKLDDR